MDVSHSNLGHEANSNIMKITTGLQSSNLGLQCEAIAEFSNIVKKYPFPVVISPIFVQIIEAFHRGPNYLRLIVLKSCNTCLEHIGKLTCSEDIISNLSLVMVSNDPCARALCLKLFAILHPIFSANKSVHHMIILCLDSHYDIELNAAIEASNSYAPISRDFSSGVCQKLCGKLELLSTDLNLKIQLIKLARHLNHNAETIEETRKCLISLLNRYRSLEFVINIVDTLTILTTRSSIHARNQIDVLIEQIQIEDREPAILAILQNQLVLARQMSHVWNEDHISFLCHFYHKSDPIKKNNLIASCKVIEILSILAESSCPASIFPGDKPAPKNPILILIIECATAAALIESDFSDIVSRTNYFGLNLLSLISIATRDQELAEHTLNSFHVTLGTGWQKPQCATDQFSYQCGTAILKLLKSFPSLFVGFATRNVSELFQELREPRHESNRGFVQFCRFLTKLCLNFPRDSIHSLPIATAVIELLPTNQSPLATRGPDQSLAIASFILQLASCEGGFALPETVVNRLISWVQPDDDHWLAYRLARLASRYGQHGLGSRLYRGLESSLVTSDLIYWVRGLDELSLAESVLSEPGCLATERENGPDVTRGDPGLIEQLVRAQNHFHRAASCFKCSSRSLWWADEYVRLRLGLLGALYTLVVTVNQYRSSQNTRSMRLAALAENRSLFRANIDDIDRLVLRSIDADDATLEQLRWLRRLAGLFVATLQQPNRPVFMDATLRLGSGYQDYWLGRLCDEVVSRTATVTSGTSAGTAVLGSGDSQDDCQALLERMRLLMTLVTSSVAISVPLPRYMFQRLQDTEMRLMAVLNGKSVSADEGDKPIEIPLRQDQAHKLQLYGIVQQRSKIGQPFRLVNRVQISVSLVLQPSKQFLDSTGSGDRPVNNTTASPGVIMVVDKTVRLKNDYFSSQVLLDLKKSTAAAKYQLLMRASPIDSTGVKWETRDMTSCLIKVESLHNGAISKTSTNR